ncbi:MAG: hypothetical protein AAB919_00575 [Patescibacteria group bacterium]
MEHIGKHIDSPSARSKRERQTERGELMKFFMQKLNPGRVRDGYAPLNLARMGRVLVAIPTRDLYYLKSVCEDAEARGQDFSKKFWWEVKPKKEEKNKQKNEE